ncbi:cell division protein FtsQ/DivIB [Rhodoferax aquaticus]|uniref:Cell division protein FtsQ n=1 Tax=Rhodoferax aquaticus TaxID=2527691 RepID=A0A515ELI9_9BURK|nr:cell division protein FtsQ/DivIB [Rhodoferax aquaticus]QDL53526.1 FtsQ-type POTRA domain-containing protein [Rhodoferax aquaticus]
MADAVVAPLDVKLMNLTASVLFVAFAFLGVLTAARWASRLPLFDIRSVAVVGDVSHNNEVTLRANVAPRMRGTFFSVDLDRVRAAFEAAPWVRQAIVHRQFPNRLQVVLQEHQAVAYWGSDAESRLINSYGEVFEANLGELEQEGLPRLLGPEGQSAEVLTMYRAVAPLFAPMDMVIDQFEMTARGSWRVRLETGASIEMGRGDVAEVVSRVHRFLKTLTQVTSKYGRQVAALEAADLRHDNGYALRLRGVSTVEVVTAVKK